MFAASAWMLDFRSLYNPENFAGLIILSALFNVVMMPVMALEGAVLGIASNMLGEKKMGFYFKTSQDRFLF